MGREKRNKKIIWLKKGIIFSERDKIKKKRRELLKEVFSADAFVLVTVLSVSCSIGVWSVQIQRLEEGEFWVHMCIESLIG